MFFGSREKIIAAVEIGTTKTAVAVAQARPGESLRILGLGIAHSLGVRKGEIVDKAQATESLREAVLAAEENSGETIDRVFLALGGAHLQAVARRAKIEVCGENGHITEDDIKTARKIAEDIPLTPDRLRVITLSRGFRIDGGEYVKDPVGLAGHRLEADYMIVHGVTSRLTNIITRVTELNIEVANFTLSVIAAADAVLNDESRQLGSLVIDFGGGLTNYALYLDGRLEDLGIIGVGGDHITQDICRAFDIPTRFAEELKVRHGCVVVPKNRRDEIIEIKPSSSFSGRKVYLESLADVIRLRAEETFNIIRERVGPERLAQIGGGIYLTGGSSKISGIELLAEVTFGKGVNAVRSHDLNGAIEDLAQPALSVVFGTLLHGRKILEFDEERLPLTKRIKRFFSGVR